MISAIGVRNVVEAKVDFSKARNTIIAAVILVVALGLTNGITFTVGGHNITLTALAVLQLQVSCSTSSSLKRTLTLKRHSRQIQFQSKLTLKINNKI